MNGLPNDSSTNLVGTPSDESDEILETGRSDITTMFLSMSMRHPEGDDAAYLRWHTLDHRPEQYRLPGIRSSLRIVSTPACRAVRAASEPGFDATDHVMTYFFTEVDKLGPFAELAVALGNAGRMPFVLPAAERGVYSVQERLAAPGIKAGGDVLPWWPARGVYLLIERDGPPTDALVDVPGVAGLWRGICESSPISNAAAGQQLTYLFLDGDAVETGERLRSVLKDRWQASAVRPLFAAPFYTLVPHEWDRYLP